MVVMGRVLRRLAALSAVVALVSMLPAPCPCPEEGAAPPKAHECCAPPTGVSANEHACCDAQVEAADILVPSAGPAPTLVEATVLRLETVARLEALPRLPVVLAPSPPPAILRL